MLPPPPKPVFRWGGQLDRLMAMTDAMRAEDHCSVPNVRCTEDRQGRQTPFLCHVPDQVGWGTEGPAAADWDL